MREIFSLATTGSTNDKVLPAESGGLTLHELQQIGQEAGIEPALVAKAAASLDIRSTPTTLKKSLGLPIGLTQVVALPRAPTDREWEQLISTFRTTFDSQGVATTNGGMREWTQGNLHISIEPTATGEQMRLSTVKSDAQVLNALGMLTGGMSVVMSAGVAAAGKPEKALIILGMFGSISIVSFISNILRSPRWARERERQMAEVAEHAVKMLSNP